MSLRARLALAAGVAVAVAVVAVALSSYLGTRSDLRGQIDRSLENRVASIRDGIGRGPFGGGPFAPGAGPGAGAGGAPDAGRPPGAGEVPGGLRRAFRHHAPFGGADGTVEQITPDGAVRALDRRDAIPADARMRAIARAGRGRQLSDLTVRGTSLRVLVAGAGSVGAIVVALPLTSVDHTLADQLLLLVVIAAAGIALAALLGVLVARAALGPIARFTRQTEAIATSPQRLETDRLEVTGTDELARLAGAFNATLEALAGAVRAQRNLVADASHELRTPIATIRANLQLMRDESALPPAEREALRRDVIEELDELTALVSDVVELARGAAPGPAAGDVRLDEVVAAAAERTRRRAPRLAVELALEPTLVRGEGDRLARAVANLLDNAVKWSRDGGTIEVGLHDGRLTVRDHGPGFAETDLPFVFDRFHRAPAARATPGSGLGLAIVRQTAEAHRGRATAANAPGGGALMTLDLSAVVVAAPELVS
jgi:two-component system, OmpR family, sensor histidine kinase MprB